MQTKNIKINGQYAVGANWEWDSRFKVPLDRTARAEVIATAQPREYRPKDSWRKAIKNDGILVAFLDPENGEPVLNRETGKQQTAILQSRDIRQPWEDFQAQHQAARKDQHDAAVARRERVAALKAEMVRLLGEGVMDPDIDRDNPIPYLFRADLGRYNGTYGPTVSLSDLTALLRVAYEKGQQDGQPEGR